MNNYFNLLNSEAILKKLSTIQLISYFGAWFSNIAIYTLLIEMQVPISVISFVAMLHFLAGVVQAPFSGSVIDSITPKKLMLFLIFIEIIATFFLIFITSISDLWLLYILIFVKMAAASFYFTTEMALLPKILDGEKLQMANELHSIIWSFSYTLGMALSGFFVYLFGVTFAFILDVMMFVSAFYILYHVEINIEMIKTGENIFEMMKDTFSYLKKSKVALHLMILHAFVGFTAFDALVALLVDKYYAGIVATSLGLGLLHSARAIGLVVGPIIISKYLNNKRVVYIFVAQGLAVWLWAYLMNNFYLSLFASVIVGLFTTSLWSYTYTLLQKNIQEKYYGRIVAYNDMLFLSSAAFTSYMIGFLASYSFSLEFISVLIGSAFFTGAFYFMWILKTQKIEEISK